MAQLSGTTFSTVTQPTTTYLLVSDFTKDPGQTTWRFLSTATQSVSGAPPSSITTSTTSALPNSNPTVLPTSATAITTSLSSSSNTQSTSISSTATVTTTTASLASAHTSLSSQTHGPSPKSDSLSGGAVAGIAIASAIVAGLLGIVAGFLIAKRRKKYESPTEYISYPDREKDLPSSSTADRLQLDQFLLDSKPETSIAGELRSLGHLIQQHVEAHYHLHPVQLRGSELLRALSPLGIDGSSVNSTETLASLALEPRTRLTAIRHVIAKATFESVTMGGSSCISLLPPSIAEFNLAIPPIEDHRGNLQATELALTRWRQLSAFLLHPNRSDRTALLPSDDVSTKQAHELATALIRFLGPFVSRDREEKYEQENHLREVIVECATFGYVVFSQPSEYRFRFDSNRGLNTIVVCPGLDKISDEEGRRFQPPIRQIVDPVVEYI
ncbi:hypothetical protein F5Y19DRAFT_488548 [Xylariaceae sp. FL1651]|nr:hypothetical protein F5Y19DRAFT_488548 [Xylariaceae sp. FL1651]